MCEQAQRLPCSPSLLPRLISVLQDENSAVGDIEDARFARAALTAQGAIADAALRQADRPAALSPDPFHVGPALKDVMGRGGGYILEPGITLQADVPTANLLALVEELVGFL